MSTNRKINGHCSTEQALPGVPDESEARDEILAVQNAFRQQVARKLSGTQGAGDDFKRRASWLVPVQ